MLTSTYFAKKEALCFYIFLFLFFILLLFQIELPPPPMGEGLSYEAIRNELRPSLDWTPEYGWMVPKLVVAFFLLCFCLCIYK